MGISWWPHPSPLIGRGALMALPLAIGWRKFLHLSLLIFALLLTADRQRASSFSLHCYYFFGGAVGWFLWEIATSAGFPGSHRQQYFFAVSVKSAKLRFLGRSLIISICKFVFSYLTTVLKKKLEVKVFETRTTSCIVEWMHEPGYVKILILSLELLINSSLAFGLLFLEDVAVLVLCMKRYLKILV